jgi:hypothetical protein
MKTRRTNIAVALGVTTIVIAIGVQYPAQRACAQTAWGNSAFGGDLATWQETYIRWTFGDITVPTDSNGNAIVGKHMVLFPIPSTPGDGTPGHLDVTLSPGQSFVLPLWTVLGTSYSDGTPPDPFLPDSVFQTLNISFTIDGITVVSGSSAMNYFSKVTLEPAIPIAGFPPVDSIIWFEDIGITHGPLKPGTHTFVLHAVNTEPAFGAFFEYNNTWTVTVQ